MLFFPAGHVFIPKIALKAVARPQVIVTTGLAPLYIEASHALPGLPVPTCPNG